MPSSTRGRRPSRGRRGPRSRPRHGRATRGRRPRGGGSSTPPSPPARRSRRSRGDPARRRGSPRRSAPAPGGATSTRARGSRAAARRPAPPPGPRPGPRARPLPRSRAWPHPRGATRDALPEVAENPELQVEILAGETELLLELLHPLLELHEGEAELLDLFVGEPTALDAAQRLSLHELTQQLDHREDETGEPLLDLVGVGVDLPRERVLERVELAPEELEVVQGAVEDLRITRGRHAPPPRRP